MPLILPKPGVFDLEVKRSKFHAYCAPVDSEDAAKAVLADIRRAHATAGHHVYAYGVGTVLRCSDDGEPHQTAGLPVFNVFVKGGVVDFVCVVTRYFGGTLLGAGGLVRAYSQAAKGALEAAGPTQRILSTIYRVMCAYGQLDKMKWQFKQWGVELLDVQYTTQCESRVRVTEHQAELFLQGTGYTITDEE